MLESRGGGRYRTDERLHGACVAAAALDSLRIARAALAPAEQGLMLRALLLVPWEQMRRNTGLSLRLPEMLAGLAGDDGSPACAAAAGALIEQGEDAVRRYPIAGLLPEVRQPGQGLVVVLDAVDGQWLPGSPSEIEIDPLTAAVQCFRAPGWESNLRPLVAWWLETLEAGPREDALDRRFSDLRCAGRDDQARWRSLGLLDWLGAHPDHPRAGEALAAAVPARRSDVRKAAVDLAGALGRWDVVEGLARTDPDRGVRQRAGKVLAGRGGSVGGDGQGRLFN